MQTRHCPWWDLLNRASLKKDENQLLKQATILILRNIAQMNKALISPSSEWS